MSREYPDCITNDLKQEFDLIFNEHRFQYEKWGLQRRSLFEWMTYLTEETGELAEAISEYEYRSQPSINIINEATQVAALAVKIILIAKTYCKNNPELPEEKKEII